MTRAQTEQGLMAVLAAATFQAPNRTLVIEGAALRAATDRAVFQFVMSEEADRLVLQVVRRCDEGQNR